MLHTDSDESAEYCCCAVAVDGKGCGGGIRHLPLANLASNLVYLKTSGAIEGPCRLQPVNRHHWLGYRAEAGGTLSLCQTSDVRVASSSNFRNTQYIVSNPSTSRPNITNISGLSHSSYTYPLCLWFHFFCTLQTVIRGFSRFAARRHNAAQTVVPIALSRDTLTTDFISLFNGAIDFDDFLEFVCRPAKSAELMRWLRIGSSRWSAYHLESFDAF